jgi:hypothetical protein
MLASTFAEYEKALWSPAILPLVLGAIAALLSFYFDTRPDNKKNKLKKAWLTFIISGVGGTIVALVMVVDEQENTDAAQTQAGEFSNQLESATNSLSIVMAQLQSTNDKLINSSNELAQLNQQIDSLQKEFAEFAEFVTNNPSEIVNNNNYYNAVTNTFVTMRKVLITLNTTSDPGKYKANVALQNRIQNANQFLSSYHGTAIQNHLNDPRTIRTTPILSSTNQLPPAPKNLRVIP